MVQGGSGARPLYGTTSPNPGGQQNFFYIADDDELTVENLNIDGSVTLNGSTITSWPTGGGGGSLSNIVEDTTPQLGGNLDGQTYDITTTGDITAANFNSTSDESLKENVKTITHALDKVDSLRGVDFNWIENGQLATGVIAQEVEEILPQVVTESDGIKHVQYGNLVGVLIEAIKELKADIEDLKK
jgi:hypothetical protein